ncbi:hypothetical protein LINPERPRIM_LOCUS8656 [Linum perenne]
MTRNICVVCCHYRCQDLDTEGDATLAPTMVSTEQSGGPMDGVVGLVVRDSYGVLIFTISNSYPGITNPFSIEILAFKDAFLLS